MLCYKYIICALPFFLQFPIVFRNLKRHPPLCDFYTSMFNIIHLLHFQFNSHHEINTHVCVILICLLWLFDNAVPLLSRQIRREFLSHVTSRCYHFACKFEENVTFWRREFKTASVLSNLLNVRLEIPAIFRTDTAHCWASTSSFVKSPLTWANKRWHRVYD